MLNYMRIDKKENDNKQAIIIDLEDDDEIPAENNIASHDGNNGNEDADDDDMLEVEETVKSNGRDDEIDEPTTESINSINGKRRN